MGQLTLLSKKEDYERVFADGDIVIQTWAWIGDFQTIFPFWQVRFSEIHEGKRVYFCSAVPYGSHPMQDHWFGKEDLMSIGLKWRVPTWEEQQELCQKHAKASMYLLGLNASSQKDGEWYHLFYPPYPEEKELVDMLKSTELDYTSVTRDNFDKKMKILLNKKS